MFTHPASRPEGDADTAHLCASPLACYQQDLEREDFVHDPAQEAVVHRLQALFEALDAPPKEPLLTRLAARLRGRHPAPPRGLYLWGGVGRGKTHLVDRLHGCLPADQSERVHFHRFMQHIHGELRTLRDKRDPLALIGRRLAVRTRVLCFDEFHVADIGDAMILAGVLRSIFDHGITLVATSNTAPDNLYRDGLQRERFLPAIELIHRHTNVVHIDGEMDYRLRALDRDSVYHAPITATTDASLQASFTSLAGSSRETTQSLEINARPVNARRLGDGVAWFDFAELCETPRSQLDYIELARCFHTVILSDVPVLDGDRDDGARRFVHLIDELYDRRVNLIVSAAAAPDALYTGNRLKAAFQRTASRLLEMQSRDYLAMEHRP